MKNHNSNLVILIFYTTKYRNGGSKFRAAACTMEENKRKTNIGVKVCRFKVESKKEFRSIINKIKNEGQEITELHFIGHSGMYGPMFGTTSWPEQFSPYEWRTFSIPFSQNAQAWFHACRTARWFAPFFAKTFKISTYGFYLYTSFSSRSDKFCWYISNKEPVYIVSCPGKKTHGLLGSFKKYTGLSKLEIMNSFEPNTLETDSTYKRVAHLYDDVFLDISVRSDELSWLKKHISKQQNSRILDIGCGNGALLHNISNLISEGTGVDISPELLNIAKSNCSKKNNIFFKNVSGPFLPFSDKSFDVIISLMSFRYLDWDPIMDEIKRVLVPGGKILIIDMVEAPIEIKEFPKFLHDKLKVTFQRLSKSSFRKALKKLVTNPHWIEMLKHNPIRSEHELKWYLESRFPGRKIEKINIGWNTRIIAFDTGPIESWSISPQNYP